MMLLAGDIGAITTRLALVCPVAGPRKSVAEEEFPSAGYKDVAGPVVAGRAHLTNLPWDLEEGALCRDLGLDRITLLNDLETIADAVPHLQPGEMVEVNAGAPVPHSPIAVLAPGAGLGEAFLIWSGEHYVTCASEGGHADFAPTDEVQAGLWKFLSGRFRHPAQEPRQQRGGIPRRPRPPCGPARTHAREGHIMTVNAPKALNQLGQSLWLDNISRDLLDHGTLAGYIETNSVTGLTSNPTIFDQAISRGSAYDDEISRQLDAGRSGETLFFVLAVQDLVRAADLFAPVHARTDTVDGFVSLEVSPLLAYDTAATLAQAKALHAQAGKPNLFIKIPGTPEGLPAIEDAIFAGVPVNVTLLFSAAHYKAAADAYLKGLERRVAAGLPPDVRSVASLFVSRWDRAVADKVPAALRNTLGIAVGQTTYQAYRDVLESNRFQRLQNLGARPQRLLFASTGTKDKSASDTLYVAGLAAPNTINTMPEATLKAYADHGAVPEPMPRDGGSAGKILAAHAEAGIDPQALAAQLQTDGAEGFVKSWRDLLAAIDAKSKVVA